MDFVAIDTETADYANACPCSIAIVTVKNNEIVSSASWLVDPECEFNPYAVQVHHITPDDVRAAPTLPEIWPEVLERIGKLPIVAHNCKFDLAVLRKSVSRYGLFFPQNRTYCTMTISRRLLPDISNYRLSTLCDYFGISLTNAHDAEADAVACARVMIELQSVYQGTRGKTAPSASPPPSTTAQHTTRKHAYSPYGDVDYSYTPDTHDFDTSHPLYGKVCVLTGELKYSRSDVVKMVVKRGGRCDSAVTYKTDYLVLGDLNHIANVGVKSLKQQTAEKYIAKGIGIRIISSDQFYTLLDGGTIDGADESVTVGVNA